MIRSDTWDGTKTTESGRGRVLHLEKTSPMDQQRKTRGPMFTRVPEIEIR